LVSVVEYLGYIDCSLDDICYVANVGDSRAIMSCNRGTKVIDLSKDHKPSEESEKERIEKNGGRTYQ